MKKIEKTKKKNSYISQLNFRLKKGENGHFSIPTLDITGRKMIVSIRNCWNLQNSPPLKIGHWEQLIQKGSSVKPSLIPTFQ